MIHLDLIFSIVGMLLSVAFFTIMERKIMGLMHFRKGPNKVVLYGVSQPIADAMKLLTKETSKMKMSKIMLMGLGPSIGFFLLMCSWSWFDYNFLCLSSNMKLLILLAVSSMVVYMLLSMSWGSNSKYALLGGHRGVAQVISYEVCLIIFIISVIYFTKSYNYTKLELIQQNMWSATLCLPLFITWLMLCLAESNRTPFDMAEGESEIVSGFNIEYGGGLFALIFITEYGMMLIYSFLTCLIFLGSSFMLLKMFMVSFIYVWTRCSFPRVRYDKLMMMSWKMALPFVLIMMTVSMINL